jgi:prepilin-type processing-associated H-X9-DG protein
MVATHANWLTLLLPHLGQAELAGRFNRNAPITDWSNKAVREAELSVLACPADTFHNANNHFQALLQVSGSGMSTASASGQARSKTAAAPVVDFARGNYAINMGTSATASAPGTCRYPIPCGTMTEQKGRQIPRWGNGVAGVNKAFASKEFMNRLGTTVAVDEIRSGLRCVDSRGAWALGLIGCSATFGHGIYGDAAGPNPDRAAADEIIGCGEIGGLIKYGSVLADENMRCRSCQVASQAAARSMHPGGVNVLMLDGSAYFVGDGVDLGLWHSMHSRETQEPISLQSNG